VIDHGLDDIVQSSMSPMGDRATGRIRSHTKRRGLEHTRHLHIGWAPLGNRQITKPGL
jgi:hypothetical protein